jgi:hypothetical protein
VELLIRGTTVTLTETEEDPDGSDRGGYLQVSHELRLEDGHVTYELTADDQYEERLGGNPDTLCEDKDDAVRVLREQVKQLRQQANQLERLLPEYEAATGFHSIGTDFEDDEDDDVELD